MASFVKNRVAVIFLKWLCFQQLWPVRFRVLEIPLNKGYPECMKRFVLWLAILLPLFLIGGTGTAWGPLSHACCMASSTGWQAPAYQPSSEPLQLAACCMTQVAHSAGAVFSSFDTPESASTVVLFITDRIGQASEHLSRYSQSFVPDQSNRYLTLRVLLN
jgi:hypothetical protein